MTEKKKGYTIDIDDDIVHLRVFGIWNADDARAYANAFEDVARKMKNKKWFVVADISAFPPQSPAVNDCIKETMDTAQRCGMQKAANIVDSALTKLQISRLSQESGIPEFSFFTDKTAAISWLRSKA